MHELRLALRRLRRDKGFTLTAFLTLTVCLAANVALFTVVDHVLLRPLPVSESDRLVYVYNSYPNLGAERAGATAPDFAERRREVTAFEGQALFRLENRSLVDAAGTVERIHVMPVTASFFPLAGVAPQRGRPLAEEAGEPGGDAEVVLSDGFWRQAFGGRDVAGDVVRLDGIPHTIVGVMPPDFILIEPDVQAWVPIVLTPEQLEARIDNNWGYVARLARGATIEQAQAQIDALNAANLERFPETRAVLEGAGFRSVVTPLQDDLVREVRSTLYLLSTGALFVLLIGGVNVTGLTLVRARVRLREVAMRVALGGGRRHLVRQFVVEHLLLAVAAGLGSLLLADVVLGIFAAVNDALPRGAEIALDGRIVGYTLTAALLIGVLLGLISAFGGFPADLNVALRDEGRAGTSGRRTRATERALVTVQVATAFMLLIGAGLLFSSFREILDVDPGFEPAQVLTGSVTLPDARYGNDDAIRRFTDNALTALRAIPSVTAAGAATMIPFGDSFTQSVMLPEGFQLEPGESLIAPFQAQVTVGYFESLGVRLVSGRFFDTRDRADAPLAVIVDERLANRYWPGENPVGRRMFQPSSADELVPAEDDTDWYTVVGVAGEVKSRGLVEGVGDTGMFYTTQSQTPQRDLTFTLRTAGDPSAVIGVVRRELARLDPQLPLFDVRTMEDRMADSLSTRRLSAQLSTGFGLLALFLTALGLYGLLAYEVAQRRREIGIRIALGGTPSAISQLVLREGVLLVAGGLALGALGASFLAGAFEAELFGVRPSDPLVIAASAATLLGVSLAACGLPARRAMHVNPVEALTE